VSHFPGPAHVCHNNSHNSGIPKIPVKGALGDEDGLFGLARVDLGKRRLALPVAETS
jgi:hypothetical protein